MMPSPQLIGAKEPALRVEAVSDYESFLAIEPEWNRLVHTIAPDHPFLEHMWLRTWWDAFGAGSRLRVLVARDANGTAGIAPLILTRIRMFGLPVRRLGFFYNAHVPRAGFLVARRPRDVYRAIWEHLMHARDWDLLQLCQLPEGSETLHEISRLAAKDCRIGLWRSQASPYIPIEGSWQDFFGALPGRQRYNLRNRLKRLQQAGPAELETVHAADTAALDTALRLEAMAWKGANGTAIASDHTTSHFYRLLAGRAATRGWLRLHFLRCGDTHAAFDYSLAYGNRLHLLKLGYDPAFAPYSPSNLLLLRVLERAFEECWESYDFLGDEAEWKLRWTKQVQPHYWLFVLPRSVKGRALHFAKFTAAPIWKRLRDWMRRQR